MLTHYFAGEFTTEELKWENISGYTSSSLFWIDDKKDESLSLFTKMLSAPYGDWIMQLIFLRGGKKGFIINQPLILYRMHTGGAFTSASENQKFTDYLLALAIHECLFQKTPYSAQEFNHRANLYAFEYVQKQFAARPKEILRHWIYKQLKMSRAYLISKKIIRQSSVEHSRTEFTVHTTASRACAHELLHQHDRSRPRSPVSR